MIKIKTSNIYTLKKRDNSLSVIHTINKIFKKKESVADLCNDFV
jgi:hypothetical protein